MERTPEESHRLAPYVAILKNKLEVEAIDDTRIMKVSFEHTDPALAQAVVNTAAKNFRDRNYERKTDRFKDTSGWLDRSTRELKSKVQQAEQAMADYTQRNGIFTSEGKETLIVEKLTNLYNLAMRAETERMLKQSLFEGGPARPDRAIARSLFRH
ncbi:MAG: hypothetical protein IPJ07_18670 [Acidobacteria bacterium]|nr:hypothetical protein [Acidobacteriota bacterium]